MVTGKGASDGRWGPKPMTTLRGGEMDDDLWKEAADALLELAITAGIMGSAMKLPHYEHAQPGWRQRMRETRDWAKRQTAEIHDFAQAYDPE